MISENEIKGKQDGWTLVEVLAVLLIVGIIASIILPMYLVRVEKARADVCEVNRKEVERLYEIDRGIHSVEHMDVRFDDFLMRGFDGEVCPLDGDIMYIDGKVSCSLHGGQVKDFDGDGVPFL